MSGVSQTMVARVFDTLVTLAALACLDVSKAEKAGLMKGVSYGPTPARTPVEMSHLSADDYFCDEAAPMWSAEGRGDLEVISNLGANFVRLYGNDPRNSHSRFLDEAHSLGLQVGVGMSDWPYHQQPVGNCLKATNFDCFTQVKPLYLANLNKGFVQTDGTYHPAIRVVNVLNEPDLKMPPAATTGGADGIKLMARSLISAFDAMLDAESERGVTGPGVNFTATFSFATCSACEWFGHRPALGQMVQLDDAMRHPERYGYTPKHNITSAYLARWTHSFNTQSPATVLQNEFLDDYNQVFTTIPVYIGEYHRVRANQTEDVGMALEIAERNDLFAGISFFEYTVSYYKKGTEMDFGMFGYGESLVASMDYFGYEFDVPCIGPMPNPEAGPNVSIAEAVARVYGGRVDLERMCQPLLWTTTTTTTSAAATTMSVGVETTQRTTETSSTSALGPVYDVTSKRPATSATRRLIPRGFQTLLALLFPAVILTAPVAGC